MTNFMPNQTKKSVGQLEIERVLMQLSRERRARETVRKSTIATEILVTILKEMK